MPLRVLGSENPAPMGANCARMAVHADRHQRVVEDVLDSHNRVTKDPPVPCNKTRVGQLRIRTLSSANPKLTTRLK